jgi:hypothetical protein
LEINNLMMSSEFHFLDWTRHILSSAARLASSLLCSARLFIVHQRMGCALRADLKKNL